MVQPYVSTKTQSVQDYANRVQGGLDSTDTGRTESRVPCGADVKKPMGRLEGLISLVRRSEQVPETVVHCGDAISDTESALCKKCHSELTNQMADQEENIPLAGSSADVEANAEASESSLPSRLLKMAKDNKMAAAAVLAGTGVVLIGLAAYAGAAGAAEASAQQAHEKLNGCTFFEQDCKIQNTCDSDVFYREINGNQTTHSLQAGNVSDVVLCKEIHTSNQNKTYCIPQTNGTHCQGYEYSGTTDFARKYTVAQPKTVNEMPVDGCVSVDEDCNISSECIKPVFYRADDESGSRTIKPSTLSTIPMCEDGTFFCEKSKDECSEKIEVTFDKQDNSTWVQIESRLPDISQDELTNCAKVTGNCQVKNDCNRPIYVTEDRHSVTDKLLIGDSSSYSRCTLSRGNICVQPTEGEYCSTSFSVSNYLSMKDKIELRKDNLRNRSHNSDLDERSGINQVLITVQNKRGSTLDGAILQCDKRNNEGDEICVRTEILTAPGNSEQYRFNLKSNHGTLRASYKNGVGHLFKDSITRAVVENTDFASDTFLSSTSSLDRNSDGILTYKHTAMQLLGESVLDHSAESSDGKAYTGVLDSPVNMFVVNQWGGAPILKLKYTVHGIDSQFYQYTVTKKNKFIVPVGTSKMTMEIHKDNQVKTHVFGGDDLNKIREENSNTNDLCFRIQNNADFMSGIEVGNCGHS